VGEVEQVCWDPPPPPPPPYKDPPKGLLAFQSVSAQTLATAESKKMAAMAFANYKRRVSSAANFAQKQEIENKQFAADENKSVDKKWSCDEDGVHISTMWSPIPRSFILIWTSSSFKARQ